MVAAVAILWFESGVFVFPAIGTALPGRFSPRRISAVAVEAASR